MASLRSLRIALQPALLQARSYSKKEGKEWLRAIVSKHSKDQPLRCWAADSDNRPSHHERPVVLLFGWLMSKEKHLERYADWYTDKGMDVVGVLSRAPHVVKPAYSHALSKQLVDLLHEESDMVRRPVVIHGFSVGGYLCGQFIREVEQRGLSAEFQRRTKAQVFDSPVDYEGIPFGVAKAISDNAAVQKVTEASLQLFMRVNKPAMHEYVMSSKTFKRNPLRVPTHVMYSHKDPICDAHRIEAVMAEWRKQGHAVSHSVFDDSEHVQHMRKYYDDYYRDLMAFLKTNIPGHFLTH